MLENQILQLRAELMNAREIRTKSYPEVLHGQQACKDLETQPIGEPIRDFQEFMVNALEETAMASGDRLSSMSVPSIHNGRTWARNEARQNQTMRHLYIMKKTGVQAAQANQ